MRLWSMCKDRIIDRLVRCVLPRIEATEDVVSVHAGWIRDLQAKAASQRQQIGIVRDEKDALVFRVAGLRSELDNAERQIARLRRSLARVRATQSERCDTLESRVGYLEDLIASRTDAMASPSRN